MSEKPIAELIGERVAERMIALLSFEEDPAGAALLSILSSAAMFYTTYLSMRATDVEDAEGKTTRAVAQWVAELHRQFCEAGE